MATLQFYKNNYYYPHYSNTITPYGSSMQCTPVGINLRSGTLRVAGDMADFMSCNYLAFTRDGQTLYAWIEDVRFRTEDSFEVDYSVDPFRTYKNKVNFGVQFIERSPVETKKYDPLLGSEKHTNDITWKKYSIGDPTKRYAVVQVRPEDFDGYSNVPVQPTPYSFFITEYTANQWALSLPLFELMDMLRKNAETKNIVTIYSIPYMDLSGTDLPISPLPVEIVGEETPRYIDGWRLIGSIRSYADRLNNFTPLNFPQNITTVKHSVMLVFPEAGIMSVPSELLEMPGIGIRQDVDLFSGASNFTLASHGGDRPYHYSVRGSSVSSIPILSDPYDTYISQNQNTLASSMLGDVASLGFAGAQAITGNYAGSATSAAHTILSMKGQQATLEDAQNKGFSNPPAFLGTALSPSFNQQFWEVTIKTNVNNRSTVNNQFGYPFEKVATLSIPSSGYIKTRECSVMAKNGNVPKWALQEINQVFNNGILFH